ncbi:hypothetical protein ACLUWG_06520 [Bifidobacterium apri]|uniref:hypothetical protein n=1 Tax=Bifidobacterium apri TaxID=1769423 RepID=UPI0039953456
MTSDRRTDALQDTARTTDTADSLQATTDTLQDTANALQGTTHTAHTTDALQDTANTADTTQGTQPNQAHTAEPHTRLPLDDREREAVRQLSQHNPYQRMSRIAILRSLPSDKQWEYFRQNLLAPIAAIIAGVLIAILLIIHLLTPTPTPKLYVAVLNGALGSQDGSALQAATAKALNLPDGRAGGVSIDTYFNLDADGLTKLQTMLRAGDIDVIIAKPKDFQRVAGYGYCKPLNRVLSKTRQRQLAAAYVSANGFDDGHDDDMEYNGSGKGASQPFGLSMTDFRNWQSQHGATRDAVIAFAQDSRNTDTAVKFIDYLRGAKV